MRRSPFDPAAAPPPGPQARARSAMLCEKVRARIAAGGGAIGFDEFMDAVLYEPGLGYYSAGIRSFGADGDFTTAPEISGLFAECLSREVAAATAGLEHPEILELGAGSGALAAGLLHALGRSGQLPRRYRILEVSAALAEGQRERLRPLAERLGVDLAWLDRLPERPFDGVIIANEVLDALPAQRFAITGEGPREICVAASGEGFVSRLGPPDVVLAARVGALEERLGRRLEVGYRSEIRPLAGPWLCSLADALRTGLVLVIDYGYGRGEYYHPQRDAGTLQCHYRHRAHDDPYILVGLQDMTISVDFSCLAEAAAGAGLDLAGYTTQAWFLLSTGILSRVGEPGSTPSRWGSGPGSREYYEQVAALKTLTLPGGMGEVTKVAAFGRGPRPAPVGFIQRDLRDRL